MSAKKQAASKGKKKAAARKAPAIPAPEEAASLGLLEKLLKMPEEERRIAFLVVCLHMPGPEREQVLVGLAEKIRKQAHKMEREAASYAADLAIIADMIQERRQERGDGSAAAARLEECCDEGLAFLMRDSHGLERAAKSESRELTCTACGAMHETHSFLRALRRDLELSEDDTERRETLRYFAHHVHTLAEGLADLIEKHPEAAKGIGGDYPNWPFLMFKRESLPADLRKQADLIGLGETCAVNPAPRVNWNELQKYLFGVFWEWQDVKRFLGCEPSKGDDRTPVKLVKVCLANYPLRPESEITDAEAELFLESFKLPPLTKGRESGKLWAERFLVPLIDVRTPDLLAELSFADWLASYQYKPDREGILVAIKEGVIRALEAMAR